MLRKTVTRRAVLRSAAVMAAAAGATRLDALLGPFGGARRISASSTWYLYFACTAWPTKNWHEDADWWAPGGNTYAIDYDSYPGFGSGDPLYLVVKKSTGATGAGRADIHDSDTPDISENKGVDFDVATTAQISSIFGHAAYHHVIPNVADGVWYSSGRQLGNHPSDDTDLGDDCYTAAHVHQAGDGAHEYSYSASTQVTTDTKGWRYIVP